jgi:F0F1-type ATP synthase membrane subunit a
LFPFLLLFAISLLEIMVAIVQAYVYFMLLCIYLGDALRGPAH